MDVHSTHQKETSFKLVRQIVSSVKFLNLSLSEQQSVLKKIIGNSTISEKDLNYIFRQYRSNLKIATFNVMSNLAIGSEAPQVLLCQNSSKNQGWHNNQQNLSECSYNSALLLSDYKLFGLQEVNRKFQPTFEQAIIKAAKNKQHDQKQQKEEKQEKDYRFVSSYYFGNFGIVIGYDINEMGPGIQITPNNYIFGEENSTDRRGMQAIFFPVRNLLMINLHAPHDIDLLVHLNMNFNQIGKLFLSSEMGKTTNIKKTRVIVTGDFNDFKGLLIKLSIEGKLMFLGKILRMHTVKDVPISCCTDTKYQYVGDYIFDSLNNDNNNNDNNNNDKTYYYDFPLGYDRTINLLSDHDPVVLLELDNLKGRTFNGTILKIGSYVEIRLTDLDEDMLLDIAKVYLKRKGIDWSVDKPLAWTKYKGGPHITLSHGMAVHAGQNVTVELGHLYHYVSESARWVMISAEIPSKFSCQHECHLSLAEGRFK
jgi:hypothetical protein